MKFPCTLKNALLIIRDHFGLSFASKGLGYLAALLLLLSLLARYKLSCYQTTPLLTILALADITLMKTTCHFLLLLVGFDTLTYRKELQLISYTCGSSRCCLHSVAWFSYWIGNLGYITEGNTYLYCTASSSLLLGNPNTTHK